MKDDSNVTKLYRDAQDNVEEVLASVLETNPESVIVISVVDGEPDVNVANVSNPFEILSLLQYAGFLVNLSISEGMEE
jgi:hypothetical protein